MIPESRKVSLMFRAFKPALVSTVSTSTWDLFQRIKQSELGVKSSKAKNGCSSIFTVSHIIIIIIIIIITYLLTAIEFSLDGSSPYTSTDNKIRINIHKRNNTKTQYKQ
jgi:chromate transport protein ChrA